MKQASDASPHPKGPLRVTVASQAKGHVIRRLPPTPIGEPSGVLLFLGAGSARLRSL